MEGGAQWFIGYKVEFWWSDGQVAIWLLLSSVYCEINRQIKKLDSIHKVEHVK